MPGDGFKKEKGKKRAVNVQRATGQCNQGEHGASEAR